MPNKKNILVVNGYSYGKAVWGLGQQHRTVSEFFKDPKSFDLILFTGGEDVDPYFYGDTSPKGYCGSSIPRDFYEKKIFDVAVANGILMAGICRGLQFINCMAGGKMLHHINSHAGRNHNMVTSMHGELVVNSYHHQMILPPPSAKVIGWAARNLSDIYIGAEDEDVEYCGKEIEAAIFPDCRGFGVQYHPEALSDKSDGYDYFYMMVKTAMYTKWEQFIKEYYKEDNEVIPHNNFAAG